jgi:hypothetical protein
MCNTTSTSDTTSLVGAVIVGVGLPQLCVERDLIRDYFQDRNGIGFEYAYTFPGMNRVLQAVGRVNNAFQQNANQSKAPSRDLFPRG